MTLTINFTWAPNFIDVFNVKLKTEQFYAVGVGRKMLYFLGNVTIWGRGSSRVNSAFKGGGCCDSSGLSHRLSLFFLSWASILLHKYRYQKANVDTHYQGLRAISWKCKWEQVGILMSFSLISWQINDTDSLSFATRNIKIFLESLWYRPSNTSLGVFLRFHPKIYTKTEDIS